MKRVLAAVFVMVCTATAFGDDETSLIRVKANPENYTSRPFVIRGSLQISDYYNYSYIHAQKSHVSLYFREAGSSFFGTGESAFLYLPRAKNQKIIDTLTDAGGKVSSARVLVAVDSASKWDMMSVYDVQFGSGPWVLDKMGMNKASVPQKQQITISDLCGAAVGVAIAYGVMILIRKRKLISFVIVFALPTSAFAQSQAFIQRRIAQAEYRLGVQAQHKATMAGAAATHQLGASHKAIMAHQNEMVARQTVLQAAANIQKMAERTNPVRSTQEQLDRYEKAARNMTADRFHHFAGYKGRPATYAKVIGVEGNMAVISEQGEVGFKRVPLAAFSPEDRQYIRNEMVRITSNEKNVQVMPNTGLQPFPEIEEQNDGAVRLPQVGERK